MPLSAANKTVAAGYRHESLNMHSKNKQKKPHTQKKPKLTLSQMAEVRTDSQRETDGRKMWKMWR